MVKTTIHRLIDDLDQTEIPDGEGETVRFGLDGKSYEIDLTDAHAIKLRSHFNRYVEAGRKTSTTTRSTKTSSSKHDLAAVREWARSNGHEVSARGRVSGEVLSAYDEATGSSR
ncbi:histone-like nucleoid-structuring protein Lsr2 [Microbacterium sp.]|uniref:histone-like nucleoid-structuring protein Lsr2 n=1 Tax=Microbacterium sp. TaxID=51671 RepID=UPI003F964F90